MKVNVVSINGQSLPSYNYQHDAGMDLSASLKTITDDKLIGDLCSWDDTSKCIRLFSGGRVLVPTGIKCSIPVGYELQIRPRSGLALKRGITVLNAPGTIDCGYTSEIGIILFNTSSEAFEIYDGDRIAQAVLSKFNKIEWNEVESLEKTERGENGFGSTGV